MKVVILAGGYGTRISEESYLKPKPMIEIGDKPILWHIMKEYSYYGYHDFIICCGYKQHVIKEWFADYYLYNSDITFDLKNNNMTVHNNFSEEWKVTLVDTGLDTMTGGRVKRIQKYVGDEPFMLTYGDGVCDVNIKKLEEFHRGNGKLATVTAVNVGQRYGILDIEKDGNIIKEFREKDEQDGDRINGGYMVFNPEVFAYIQDDTSILEKDVLQELGKKGELIAYKYDGYWQCMDTKREKDALDALWKSGRAPWKHWSK